MKGTAVIQSFLEDDRWSDPPETLENVSLSLFSETREAVLSRLREGDVRELVVLEHAVIDIFVDDERREVIEVKGFRRDPDMASRYLCCRIVFSVG